MQTIGAHLLPAGNPPPSRELRVSIGNGDLLSLQVSIPHNWNEGNTCVVLVHGMGGSHNSSYMVRLSRKFYNKGCKVVRVNLRGCGSGKGLSSSPYHAGTSQDLQHVLELLKNSHPQARLVLIGFSLGANVVLKLAGELGVQATSIMDGCIAICPPVDLAASVAMIQERRNWHYHYHYLKMILRQAEQFTKVQARSIYEFDDTFTAPSWGYKEADDYYKNESSKKFLSAIKFPVKILFAEDDPFISIQALNGVEVSKSVQIYICRHGGHLGFLGSTKGHFVHWMDSQLFKWILSDSEASWQAL